MITSTRRSLSFWERLRFRNWRISVKLIVITLLVALLPLLMALFIVAQTSAEALLTQSRANLTSMAASTARVLSNAFDYYRSNADTLAQSADVKALLIGSPDEREAARPDAEGHLADIFADPDTEQLAVFDRQGTAVLHSDSEQVGQRADERQGVQTALEGRIYISPLRFYPDQVFPSVDIALPIRREGGDSEVIGAVALRFRASYLDFLVRDTLYIQQGRSSEAASPAQNADTSLYVIDPDGILMIHSAKQTEWRYRALGAVTAGAQTRFGGEGALGGDCPQGMDECEPSALTPRTLKAASALQPLADGALRTLVDGAAGNLRYCVSGSLDAPAPRDDSCVGAWHLAGYAPVVEQTTGARILVVVADMREDSVLQSVDRQRQQGLAIAALVVPIAALISLVVSRTLARPINKLAAVAHDVEEGRPFDSARIADLTAAHDELGNLARVFGAMIAALRARMDELRTIHEISVRISASVELRETLEYIATSIRQAIPYDWAEICLYNQAERRMLVHVAADHDSIELVNVAPYADDQGFVGKLMATRDGLLIPDLRSTAISQPGRSWDHLQPQSYLGVPLKHQGKVIGTIEMISRRANGFEPGSLRILESIAVQAAVALQNAQQVREREDKLRQEIHELRIEIDQAKKTKQVQAITETAYFQDLQQRVTTLRARRPKPEG